MRGNAKISREPREVRETKEEPRESESEDTPAPAPAPVPEPELEPVLEETTAAAPAPDRGTARVKD